MKGLLSFRMEVLNYPIREVIRNRMISPGKAWSCCLTFVAILFLKEKLGTFGGKRSD